MNWKFWKFVCGKVDYKSEETATKAALGMNNKPSTRNTLEPYECMWCGGWHIGRKKDDN